MGAVGHVYQDGAAYEVEFVTWSKSTKIIATKMRSAADAATKRNSPRMNTDGHRLFRSELREFSPIDSKFAFIRGFGIKAFSIRVYPCSSVVEKFAQENKTFMDSTAKGSK